MEKNKVELFERMDYIRRSEKNIPIPHMVLFDNELTKNDIAIYIAIKYSTNFDETKTLVNHKKITKLTGILQPNQSQYIDRLESKRYIIRESSADGFEYSVVGFGDGYKFTTLSFTSVENMTNDTKLFVNKLTYLALSSGNNRMPTYATCQDKLGKLSRRRYKSIKDSAMGIEEDVDIYDSLSHTASKELSIEDSGNTLNVDNNSLELEGLLGLI